MAYMVYEKHCKRREDRSIKSRAAETGEQVEGRPCNEKVPKGRDESDKNSESMTRRTVTLEAPLSL